MNTTRFEYLLALERTGTMTGVAKAYFISPSAVSQCLKNEEALSLIHIYILSKNVRLIRIFFLIFQLSALIMDV